MTLPPVCILAGGRGTRLGARTDDAPKPLIHVAGRPFIEHVLELLARNGARKVVLCVGYRADAVQAALGDGTRFGLELAYSHDGPALAGTAGALRGALSLLGTRFLVLYGDTYLPVDYADVASTHATSGYPALMTVLHNRGRWGRSNAVVADGRVQAYDKDDPPPGAEWIDYGLLAFDSAALGAAGSVDLADVLRERALDGELGAYAVTRRFHEIGTPEALAETDAFLTAASRSGEARARSGPDLEVSRVNARQDPTSVEKNKSFFARNMDYEREVGALDTYRNIREATDRELAQVERLLDIGNGGVFDYDTSLVPEIVAVDFFLDDVPRSAFPSNVTPRRGDALDLDEANDDYDGVLLAMVFHHLIGRTTDALLVNVRRAIEEAHRVLRPGGKLVVVESCVPPWFYPVERALFAPLVAFSHTRFLRHPPTLQLPVATLVGLLSDRFEAVRAQRIPVGRWLLHFGKRWPSALTPARPYIVVAHKAADIASTG